MARALRITFPDAWYHIMNRGTNRQQIFLIDAHRRMFLDVLDEVCEKHSIEIHAYCLMDNHYHLMMKTPEPNISKAMHYIDTVYAIRFNKMTGREGPVFTGRYCSVLVQGDAHFLELTRYIHLNPIRANMIEKPEYYKWSSYRAYIGHCTPQPWLHTRYVLSNFSKEGATSYQAFVDEQYELGLQINFDEFYKRSPVPPFLGSREFIKEVKKHVVLKGQEEDISQRKYLRQKYELEDIIQVVMKVTNVTRAKILLATRGRRNDERLVFMFIAREKCGYTLNEIRDYMGLKCRTTITMGVKRMKVFMEDDSLLKSSVALCLTELLALTTIRKD